MVGQETVNERKRRLHSSGEGWYWIALQRFTQTTAARASLAICARRGRDRRAQPSETMTTTAPRESARRPYTARTSGRAGCVPLPVDRARLPERAQLPVARRQSGASRGSRQRERPPRPVPDDRRRWKSSARAYASIEPEMSRRRASGERSSVLPRPFDRLAARPQRWRQKKRMSSTSPRGSAERRRDMRRGRVRAIAAMRRRTRSNSSGVISAKSFSRMSSCPEAPSSCGVDDSSASSSSDPDSSVSRTTRSAKRRVCFWRTSGATGPRRNHATNARSKSLSSPWRGTLPAGGEGERLPGEADGAERERRRDTTGPPDPHLPQHPAEGDDVPRSRSLALLWRPRARRASS